MKTLLLISATFLCLTVVNGQTPNWIWAKNSVAAGTPSHDEGRGIAIDADGNVYISGFFQSTTISFGSFTFTKSGGADIFLVKYDASGNIIWAKSFGGSNTDYATDLALDTLGNVFMTGNFNSPTIIFDSETLSNSGSGDDVFLAKINPSGNVLWAKSSVGSSGSCKGNSVETDKNGNAYITGYFYSSSFSIGPFTLANTATGCQDAFIAKFDANGNVIWAKNPVGTGCDEGKSITTDNFGNIYVTGYGNSPSLTFDSVILTNNNPGSDNVFFAKYDSDGNIIWVRGSQGVGSNYGNCVTTDNLGNSYITGSFSYSANVSFGAFTLTNVISNKMDVFLVKYDSAGNEIWAKSAGGEDNDRGFSVITDATNNVYVAGGYSFMAIQPSSISFGSITLPFPSDGLDPMFITKYDSNGNELCAFSLPTGGDDIQAIAIDAFNNLYIGGDNGVNPLVLGSNILSLTGEEDVYVAKFTFGCDVTGISTLQNIGQLTISPNPFTTSTTLSIKNLFNDGTLTVNNCLGQTVAQINLSANQLVNLNGQTIIFNRENLPSGLYFVRLTEEEKIIAIEKLIITDY